MSKMASESNKVISDNVVTSFSLAKSWKARAKSKLIKTARMMKIKRIYGL